MLEFIAIHRLTFVIIIALILATLLLRSGWRNSIMGAAVGVMIGSATVVVAIGFNATQLWWLPTDQQTPLNIDVPSLLDPVVAPVEAIAAGQLHLEAAVIAMKALAYYTAAVVVAMIVVILLRAWKDIEFRRDVQFVKKALKNNPQLLK
jgi:hypothetical protein